MHGIQGGQHTCVQVSGCLTASAKHCFHPSSRMSFTYGCKCVCCLALGRSAVADKDVLSFHHDSSAMVAVAWNTAPEVVEQTMLLLNCAAEVFPGQMMLRAEWEGGWESASYQRAVAMQVHKSSYLVVWNNIFGMEKIRIYSHRMM